MPIIYQKFINREDLKANPKVLYVFGDNMQRHGMGGQAGAMRGEPNAVGVATKELPSQYPNSFFYEKDWIKHSHQVRKDFFPVRMHLNNGGLVVIPLDGLGTGLSELHKYAPSLDLYIKDYIKGLEEVFRVVNNEV